MFWIFLLVAVAAVTLIQLGALSVWVVVLRFGLMAALLMVGLFVLAAIWRRISGRFGR